MSHNRKELKKIYETPLKLLLIGESGVGKSCLLLRYCDNQFTHSYITTIGIDFKVKTLKIEDEEVKLQIWDTAGQERFRNITLAYFRGAMGIILVYDICDIHSFQSVHHWMHSINENASDDVNIILVGNKCDMLEQRKVTTESGIELAEHYNIPFFEASAKTGYNVESVFAQLARNIVEKLKSKLETKDKKSDTHSSSISGKNKKYDPSNNNNKSDAAAIDLEKSGVGNGSNSDTQRLRDHCSCTNTSFNNGSSSSNISSNNNGTGSATGTMSKFSKPSMASLRKFASISISKSDKNTKSTDSINVTANEVSNQKNEIDENNKNNENNEENTQNMDKNSNTMSAFDANDEKSENDENKEKDIVNQPKDGKNIEKSKTVSAKEVAQLKFESFQMRMKETARKQKQWIESSRNRLLDQRHKSKTHTNTNKNELKSNDENDNKQDFVSITPLKIDENIISECKDNNNNNNNNKRSDVKIGATLGTVESGLLIASNASSSRSLSPDVSSVSGIGGADTHADIGYDNENEFGNLSGKKKKKHVGNGYHMPNTPDIGSDDNFDFLGVSGTKTDTAVTDSVAAGGATATAMSNNNNNTNNKSYDEEDPLAFL